MHADFFAVVHERSGLGGEEHGGEDLVDLVVVDTVTVAIDGADVVVVVEDDEWLRTVDLGLDFFDVLAERCCIQLVVITVETDQHVHRKLQFVVCGSTVPFVEFCGVGQIGFANEDAVAGILRHHRTHATDDVVDLGQVVGVDVAYFRVALGVGVAEHGVIAELGIFEEIWNGVKAEAGDASIQPELHGSEHRFFDGGIAPVEVGLLLVELVVIELVHGWDPLPCRASEVGDPVIGRNAAVMLKALLVGGDTGRIGGLAVVPAIPIVLGVGAGTGGFDEPLVFVRGVVEDHVEEDADVVSIAFGDEMVHVGEGAILRIGSFIVGDVVAKVHLGRGIHGGDPDGVDAEALEVAEAGGDAVEVTDAVSI